MKSPDQVNQIPKPFKERAMEEKDREAWEEAKKVGTFFAIEKGVKLGVPEEELNRFAQEVIDEKKKNDDWGGVYGLMKSLGMGTQEELQEIGEKAYKFFLDDGEFDSAMDMAERIFGKDSEEWRLAYKSFAEKEKKYQIITLPSSATIEELIELVKKIEEENGEGSVYDEEQWWDSFPPEVTDAFFAVDDTSITLVNFFKAQGYEIPMGIPIRFKPKSKTEE